jgi:hypothetical protein
MKPQFFIEYDHTAGAGAGWTITMRDVVGEPRVVSSGRFSIEQALMDVAVNFGFSLRISVEMVPPK